MTSTKVPDFTAAATGGAPFRLSDHKGKAVVLYFYPKDDTPGCTTEGADFRDLHKQFVKAGGTFVTTYLSGCTSKSSCTGSRRRNGIMRTDPTNTMFLSLMDSQLARSADFT